MLPLVGVMVTPLPLVTVVPVALLVVTAVVMFTDRQRMFWHMLAWLPVVLEALRRGSRRTALGITAWAVVGAQAALDTVIPFNVLWLWLRAV